MRYIARSCVVTRAAVALSGSIALTAVRHAHAQSTRDSAGVRIAENARPARTDAAAWRVDDRPFLDIGGTSGDTLYEFLRMMAVIRLAPNRILIANQATNTLRFYDSAGKFTSFAGRSGDGPGEFRQILGVTPLAGDTLAIRHSSGITYYSTAGRFLRDGIRRNRMSAPGGRFIGISSILSDGSYVGLDNAVFNQRSTRSGRWTDSAAMFRVSADNARTDSIGWFYAMEFASSQAARVGINVVFAPYLRTTAEGMSFYVGHAVRNEIAQYSAAGTMLRSIRWSGARQPVTRALIAEYKQKFVSQPGEDGRPAPASMRDYWTRMTNDMQFADSLPSYASFRVDRTGNLWVQRYDVWIDMPGASGPASVRTNPSPTRWEVFSPRGRWETTITLPANFSPLDIGADYVAGVWRDADDVEHARFYRLRK